VTDVPKPRASYTDLKCPVAGCRQRIVSGPDDPEKAMCDACWAKVPADLREAVALAWNSETYTPEYQRALTAAMAAAAAESETPPPSPRGRP